MARPPRGLTSSTAVSPHKMFLLVVTLLVGVIGVFYPTAIAASINDLFPWPFGMLWFAGVAVTAAVALYGVALRSLVGLLWERVALLALTLLLVAFMVSLIGLAGGRAIGTSLFYGGYAAANIYRSWIITLTLRLYPTRRAPDEEGPVNEEGSADG